MYIILKYKQVKEMLNKIKQLPSKERGSSLQNIVFFEDSGKLCMSATDLEILAVVHLDIVTISDDFKLVIPVGVNCQDFVKAILAVSPDGTGNIEIQFKDGYIFVKEIDSDFNVGLPREKATEDLELYLIKSKDLKQIPKDIYYNVDMINILNSVKYACAKDDSRFVFNGICFDHNYIAATDGKKLIKIDREKGNWNVPSQFIIPIKSVELFTDIHKKYAGIFEIGYDSKRSQIVFISDKAVIAVSKIEGQYPVVDQVIPEQSKDYFEFEKNKELIQNLKKVRTCLNKDNDFANWGSWEKVVLSNVLDGLKVLYKFIQDSKTCSEISIVIPGKFSSEIDWKIAINLNYFIETIENIDVKSLRIYFNGEHGAVRSDSPDKPEFVSVIMPIKL